MNRKHKKTKTVALLIGILSVLTGILLPVSSSALLSNAQPEAPDGTTDLFSEMIHAFCEILTPALTVIDAPETKEITITEDRMSETDALISISRTVDVDVWTLNKKTNLDKTVLTRAMQGFAIDKDNGLIYACANPADPVTGANKPGNNYVYKIETENGELKRMKTANYQLNTEHANGTAVLNGILYIAGGKPDLMESEEETGLYQCGVAGNGFQKISMPQTTNNGKQYYYSAITSDGEEPGLLYALLRKEAFVEMDRDGAIRNTFKIEKDQRPAESGIQDCGYLDNALYLVTYDSKTDSPTYNSNYIYRYLIDRINGTCILDKKYRIDADNLSLWEKTGKTEFEGIDFLTVEGVTYAYLIECGDYAKQDPENSQFTVIRFPFF